MITDGTHTVNSASGDGDLFVDGDLEVDGNFSVGGTLSGAANTALSNLASVAINTSLISDTDSTDNLGSSTVAWANLYTDAIKTTSGTSLDIDTGTIDLSTQTTAVTLNDAANALDFDSGTLSIDALNERVGIGTTAPGDKLDVQNNTIQVADNTINFADVTDGYVLTFDTGTNTWAGEAAGAGSGDITAVGSMTTGDAFAGTAADDDWLGLGAAAGHIVFDDQATDYVNILNANVGIGTTAPAQKLEVAGVVYSTSGGFKFPDGATQATAAPAAANVDSTAVGNVGLGEDNLITYSLPANSLSSNNKAVRITAWGTTANNGNAKTLKVYFGATAILTHAFPLSLANVWRVQAEVVRTGSNTQDAIATMIRSIMTQVESDIEFTTPTATDSAAITIKCTGEATANNDIVQEGVAVEFIN